MKSFFTEAKSAVKELIDESQQFSELALQVLTTQADISNTLIVEAAVTNLPVVTSFIDAELDKSGCGIKDQMQIDMAAEEIFINVARYAYAPEKGNVEIGIKVIDEPRCAILTFSDTGVPYNPLEKEDPDVTLSAEKRAIGGLGIFMVKKTMDGMAYEYHDGHNKLAMCKFI